MSETLSSILTGILAILGLVVMIALFDPSSGDVTVKTKSPEVLPQATSQSL